MAEVDGNQEQELDRIRERIVELAKAHKDEPKPYLASALGIDLGADLKTLKTLTDLGLNDFIQTQLAGRVTLIPFGPHRNVMAVVFGSVDPSAADALQLTGPPKKRFQFRFWAAFSVPPEKDVRVLDMEDFTFRDVDHAGVPEGAVTIDHALIAPADAADRDELIKSNIAQWLAAHELSEERFLASEKVRRTASTPEGLASGSLLEAIIDALDRKQLQTTSFSLDVVAILLRTPRL